MAANNGTSEEDREGGDDSGGAAAGGCGHDAPYRPRSPGLRLIVRNDDGTSYDASDDHELMAELVEALKNVVPGPECDEAERQLAEALKNAPPPR